MNKKNRLFDFLVIDVGRTSHTEKLVSALGGFTGIFGIFYLTSYFISGATSSLIIASMGASAVLVFAVPHGKLSQPWPLLGGHFISAIIGITVAHSISNTILAAALAVGTAIAAMHYLRCIHPPGGATALASVISGQPVYDMGYQFVFTPVMINALFIFIIAIAFNYFFQWRRYPVSIMPDKPDETETPSHDQAGAVNFSMFNDGDLKYAARKMDIVLDITHKDLVRLFALANKHAMGRFVKPEDLKLGSYYSNGLYGKLWEVRQVIDESDDAIIYKVVAGANRRSNASTTKQEFSNWARFEVSHEDNQWQRVENKDQQD